MKGEFVVVESPYGNRNSISSQNLWNEEYEKKNIASSFKGTLSHSVKFLLEYLNKKGANPKTFLDLGCGNGRNAIPLANMNYDVCGMDISNVALSQAKKLSEQICANQPSFYYGSMGEPLQFNDSMFDVVMDITSFDILIKDKEIECHKKEIMRVSKKGGHFLYYDMADDDPYSLELLAKSPDRDKGVIYTPTGIPFKIYSEHSIEKIFKDFNVMAQEKFKFQDMMDGKIWDRSLLCMIFRK